MLPLFRRTTSRPRRQEGIIIRLAVLHRLGWTLIFLGLMVGLAAVLSFMIEDRNLERQWLQATENSLRRTAGDSIARKRAALHFWPGILAGAGVTALGIVLLEIARRRLDWGVEREEMELLFNDGRPLAFKPGEREETGEGIVPPAR